MVGSSLFAPADLMPSSVDASARAHGGMPTYYYLRSVAELARALCDSLGFAEGRGAERMRLAAWLAERMHWTPVQPAFESTAPWCCLLQLHAARAAARAGTAHLYVRRAFCHALTGAASEGVDYRAGSDDAAGEPCSWSQPRPVEPDGRFDEPERTCGGVADEPC